MKKENYFTIDREGQNGSDMISSGTDNEDMMQRKASLFKKHSVNRKCQTSNPHVDTKENLPTWMKK